MPCPKARWRTDGTVEVEHLGIGVGLLVVVRRGQADDDLGSGGDRHAAQLDRLDGVPERRVGDRCVEAEELLQRRLQSFGVVAQQRQLIRVAEQRDDAVADEAGRRVVSGDDQLEDRRQQLPGVEALVAVTGGDQRADEVVSGCSGLTVRRAARAAPPPCRMPAWPRRTAPASRSARAARSGPDRAGVRSASGTPSSSQMTVNGNGKAKRETRSTRQSAPSAAMSVEQVVDDRLDSWPQSVDAPRREGAGDQAPQPRVVGRIDGEHVPGEPSVRGGPRTRPPRRLQAQRACPSTAAGR